MKGMNNGMMMMGGEATPENLRKAKAIIEEMLGEKKPSGCCGCNCTNTRKQILDKVKAEQKVCRDTIGNFVCDQINSLLYLARIEDIDINICGEVEYNSDLEEIIF